jgi:tryptophan-rich sensory protein
LKLVVLIFFNISILLGEETISFSSKEYTTLYKSSYSYSSDYKSRYEERGRRDYDRDNKYNYDHPSIAEPSTWSLFAGLCALSAAFVWRRKKAISKS